MDGKKGSRPVIETAIAIAVAGVFAAPALAQQSDAPVAKERIEVTGSNIKRVEGEGALPVTVITRQQIEKTGATTPTELLQLISANNTVNGTSFANVIGATTFSA